MNFYVILNHLKFIYIFKSILQIIIVPQDVLTMRCNAAWIKNVGFQVKYLNTVITTDDNMIAAPCVILKTLIMR